MSEMMVLKCAVITVSDTRDTSNDTSGDLIAERLMTAGHFVRHRAIITDDIPLLRAHVAALCAGPDTDVVLLTGGTGLTLRDVTPEAIAPIADKQIPGFGELFRFLSYQEIGTSTVQSRADAWLVGRALVFALPGSPGACRLAMDKIVIEQLDSRHRPCNFANMLPRIRGEK